MSEDHQYNEAGDHAIVSASKSSRAIDEVLMGMLRDLRKRVSKKIRTAICCFSRSFTRHGLKYPVSLHELIHIHGVGEGKAKNMVLILIKSVCHR
jgi:ATP-dependent DNA helicase RecQ